MSNYNNLKTSIDANIKQNGNQEITGPILNSVLNQMVNILGTGYQFAGVATLDPATEPGTPDAKVFYIANGKGTYTNFGGLEVTEDEVVVLYWDTAWHKVATGIASQEKLTELDSKLVKVGGSIENILNIGTIHEGKVGGQTIGTYTDWGTNSSDVQNITIKAGERLYLSHKPYRVTFYQQNGNALYSASYASFKDETYGCSVMAHETLDAIGFVISWRYDASKTDGYLNPDLLIGSLVPFTEDPTIIGEERILAFGKEIAPKKYVDDEIAKIPHGGGTDLPSIVQNTNVFIGGHSGENNVESETDDNGKYNTAVGFRCMQDNVSGDHNSAFGFQTMQKNTTGNGNSAFGEDALYENTTGTGNSACGTHALQNNTSGSGNTAVGNSAAIYNTSGFYNVYIGGQVAQKATTEARNVVIGHSADITEGNEMVVVIGKNAKSSVSREIVIGSKENNTLDYVIIGNKKIIFNADGTCSWQPLD